MKNIAVKFEQEKQLKPTEAAKVLGISYSLWKQIKSGNKPLPKYISFSIEALNELNKTSFEKLKAKRLAKDQ